METEQQIGDILQKELGEASVCFKNKTTLNLLFELTQKVKIGKKQGAFCKTELHLRLKKAALKLNYNMYPSYLIYSGK